MKKFVYTLFIGFWAVVGTVTALHLLQSDRTVAANDEGLPTYSLAEVAEHDTLDSCWMAIAGRVYDFTDYIPQHPTRPGVMLRWCGREATEGMRTKGYGEDHTPRAWAMMEDYLIGRLDDAD